MPKNSENNQPENRLQRNPERVKQPIEIGFGFVFEGINGSRYVIIDVGEGSWFGSARITTIDDGHEALGIIGTCKREYIVRMLGKQRYSLDRVLSGVMAYFGDVEPRGKMYDKIREYASKKPRKIY